MQSGFSRIWDAVVVNTGAFGGPPGLAEPAQPAASPRRSPFVVVALVLVAVVSLAAGVAIVGIIATQDREPVVLGPGADTNGGPTRLDHWHAALGVERLRCLHQGGQSCRAEVVAVHVGRHSGHGLADDVSDQCHVPHDQRLGARRDVVMGGHVRGLFRLAADVS